MEGELSLLKQQHAEEMHVLQANTNASLEQINEEHKRIMIAQEAGHEEEMGILQAEAEKAKAEARGALKALDEARVGFESELAALKEQHASAISALKSETETKINDQVREIVDARIVVLIQSVRETHQSEMDVLKEHHATEVAALQESLRRAIKDASDDRVDSDKHCTKMGTEGQGEAPDHRGDVPLVRHTSNKECEKVIGNDERLTAAHDLAEGSENQRRAAEKERDEAVRQRLQAEQERNSLHSERENILQKMAALEEEKMNLMRAKDSAERERAEALRDREELEKEIQEMMASRDRAESTIDAIAKARDSLLEEKGHVLLEKDRLAEETKQVTARLEAALGVITDKDKLIEGLGGQIEELEKKAALAVGAMEELSRKCKLQEEKIETTEATLIRMREEQVSSGLSLSHALDRLRTDLEQEHAQRMEELKIYLETQHERELSDMSQRHEHALFSMQSEMEEQQASAMEMMKREVEKTRVDTEKQAMMQAMDILKGRLRDALLRLDVLEGPQNLMLSLGDAMLSRIVAMNEHLTRLEQRCHGLAQISRRIVQERNRLRSEIMEEKETRNSMIREHEKEVGALRLAHAEELERQADTSVIDIERITADLNDSQSLLSEALASRASMETKISDVLNQCACMTVWV